MQSTVARRPGRIGDGVEYVPVPTLWRDVICALCTTRSRRLHVITQLLHRDGMMRLYPLRLRTTAAVKPRATN